MLFNLDRKELEKKIEEVLDRLIKSGLVQVSPEEKKNIVQRVTDKLVNDKRVTLSKEDLQNKDTLKSLGLCCIAELNPKHSFDYVKLFAKTLDLEPNLDQKLTALFEKKYEANKALKLTPGQKLAVQDSTKELTDLLEKKLRSDDKTQLTKDILALDILEEARAEQRIVDYGVDTHHPGAVLKIVQANVSGNQMAFQDLSTSGENFMAKVNDPSLGEDPLGIKILAVTNAIADGVVNTEAEKTLLQLLHQNNVPMYDTPTLRPH